MHTIEPKVIARHLPQFHEIPENNERWWQWYTEWTTVKKGKKMFEDHHQPRVPIDGYYDFLDIQTRKRQADVAKKYWIYWFCYYHYRFNGKKLLEKWLEAMLVDGEPDIKFCLSRANSSWARTWWKKIIDDTLMKQEYGGKEDMHNHIEYLLKFFKNKNYICIDNKPVLVIHFPKDIPDMDEMIKYRDDYCKSKWFDGIYVIETLIAFDQIKKGQLSKAVVQFEPGYNFGNMYPRLNFLLKMIPYNLKTLIFRYIQIIKNALFGSKKVYKISYKSIMDKIISFWSKKHKDKTYLWMCPWRDNTPRKEERWIVFTGESPEIFEKYFEKQYQNSIKNNNEFMFVNARNERSEWAYLEPETKFWYGYLQAIKNIVDKYKKHTK